MLGAISRRMICQVRTPLSRARSMKSRERSDSVCARTARATHGQQMSPMNSACTGRCARRGRRDDDEHGERRQHEHHVGEHVEHLVDQPAAVARDEPDRHADDGGHPAAQQRPRGTWTAGRRRTGRRRPGRTSSCRTRTPPTAAPWAAPRSPSARSGTAARPGPAAGTRAPRRSPADQTLGLRSAKYSVSRRLAGLPPRRPPRRGRRSGRSRPSCRLLASVSPVRVRGSTST